VGFLVRILIFFLLFASQAQAYTYLSDLFALDKDCTYSKSDGTGTITCYVEDYRNSCNTDTCGTHEGTAMTSDPSTRLYYGAAEFNNLRYRVNVPKSATIASAKLSFKAEGTTSGTPDVDIKLYDEDDCEPFGKTAPSTRSTSTSVDWDDIPAWSSAGTWYDSADISAIVTSWIGREGYKYDYFIGLKVIGTGTGDGVREFYNTGTTIADAPKLTITFTGGEPVMVMHMADPHNYYKQTVRFSVFNTSATDKLSVDIDGSSVYNQAVGTVGATTLEDIEVVVNFSNIASGEHTLTAKLTNAVGTAYDTTTVTKTWTALRNNAAPTVGINEAGGLIISGTTPYIPIMDYLREPATWLDYPLAGDKRCDWFNGLYSIGTSGYAAADVGKVTGHFQPMLTSAANTETTGCDSSTGYRLWGPNTGGNQWDGYSFTVVNKTVMDFTIAETFEGTGYVHQTCPNSDHCWTASASGVDPDTTSGALADSQSLKLDGTASSPSEATLTLTPKTVQTVAGIGKVKMKFMLKDITATHQQTDILRFINSADATVGKIVWFRTDDNGGPIGVYIIPSTKAYMSSSAVTFATSDDSISATSINGYFDAGQSIVVSGSSSNDGEYTIASETTDKIVVSENLTDEAPGAAVTMYPFRKSGTDLARNTLYYVWVHFLPLGTRGGTTYARTMFKWSTSNSEPADCTTTGTGCVNIYLNGSTTADLGITKIQFVADPTSTLLIDNVYDNIDDMKDFVDGVKTGYDALGGYAWMDEKQEKETIDWVKHIKTLDNNHATMHLYGGVAAVFPGSEDDLSSFTKAADRLFPETNKYAWSNVKTTPTDISIMDWYFMAYGHKRGYVDWIGYVNSMDFFTNRHGNVGPFGITHESARIAGPFLGATDYTDIVWETGTCSTAAACQETLVPFTSMTGGTFLASRKDALFYRKGNYYTVKTGQSHTTILDNAPGTSGGTSYWDSASSGTPYITWVAGIQVSDSDRKRYVQIGAKGGAEILDVRIIATDPRTAEYFPAVTSLQNDHLAINKGTNSWEIALEDTITEYSCTDAVGLPEADLSTVDGCTATGVTATVGGDSGKLPYVDATCTAGGEGRSCRTPYGTARTFWTPLIPTAMMKQSIYLSFIHGAGIVSYFPYWNIYYGFPRAAYASLKTEIEALTPMILSTKATGFAHDARKVYKQVSVTAGRVDATGRRYNDQDWIIASRVYAHNEDTDDITATFTVAGLTTGTNIVVYGESRNITAGDGSFTDTFSPEDVHIYQLGEESGGGGETGSGPVWTLGTGAVATFQ
jgi:hypothetical protein